MSDGEFYYDSSSGMSNNSHLSYSTPFKPGFRTGTSKTLATEERSHIRIPKVDNDFISTHFTSPTSISKTVTKIKTDSTIKQSLSELDQDLKENEVYGPLANIFNKVASSVCGLEPMVFHPSYDIRPSGENRHEDRVVAPDFSILPPKPKFTYKDKEGKQRIPWSGLESVIEVKRGKRWDHSQAIDYIEMLLQYRPDKVYALGMSCNQQLYQFYYADACIQKSSPMFRWKDSLDEFIQFVHTLHRNYKEEIGRDHSYTLHGVMWQQKPRAVDASARWRVSFDGRTNEVQRIFARKGKGRRTWLGIGQEINESSSVTNIPEKDRIRIVKDMWRDTSRRFTESEILNQIHKDGYIAGVVRHISSGPLNGLTVTDPIKGDRIKERVVMASTGLRLSACESVLDFLKVMYDLVETHEQLLEKRGVLHRDISWFNVLCKPEHFIGHDKVIEHPTIGKILRKEGKERGPLCLLTDFDNASLTRKEDNPCGATERTGTPMFMACELSYGSRVRRTLNEVPAITPKQLSLEGNVLEAYLEVYSKERYSEYQEWLKCALSVPIERYSPFTLSHRPHHDMESVYWIIVWFIIKAWPTESKSTFDTAESNFHNYLTKTMFSRGIELPASVSLISYSQIQWEDYLDPVYQPLIGMLVTMSRYLCMRWSELPEVLPWHAHEAFKRLLLKEIIRMTNDNCSIPIHGPRPPLPKYGSDKLSTTNKSQIPSQTGTSTHGLNTSEAQSLGIKKRQNSTPTDSEPPPKKPRRMRTTNCVEENPDLLAKFVQNLANDVWWFL